MAEYNQRKNTRELALDLNPSKSTICRNLKKIGDVGMKIPENAPHTSQGDKLGVSTISQGHIQKKSHRKNSLSMFVCSTSATIFNWFPSFSFLTKFSFFIIWFKSMTDILLIEINLELNYLWIDHILIKQKLFMTWSNIYIYIYIYIYILPRKNNHGRRLRWWLGITGEYA